MPSYELALVLRKMARSEVIETLKRTGCYILNKQGVLRKIENLGHRQLPYKLTVDNVRQTEGSYFVYYFESSPRILYDLYDECKRDIDIMKTMITRIKETSEVEECTLDEELQPPALRKSVLELLDAKKSKKKIKKFEKPDEI